MNHYKSKTMKQQLHFATLALGLLLSLSVHSQYKVDQERIYDWDDDTSTWEHEATKEFTYENDGDKETNLILISVPEAMNTFQYLKDYNASNNITTQIAQTWNPLTMAWQTISKTDYAYDGGNLMTETTQLYNFDTKDYMNSHRISYTYEGGNISSETDQSWNTGTSTWVNNERSIYEYSGANQTKHTEQDWDSSTNTWVNDEQTEIAYDASGKPQQTIVSEWDSDSNAWELDDRITYTYNGDLLIEALGEEYVGGMWVLDHRTEFIYVAGLATEMVYSEREGDAWVNVDRVLTTYDSNGNSSVVIMEEWSVSDGAWEPESKIEYEYSAVRPFVLSTDAFEQVPVVVYPNPASERIYVSSLQPIERMELYDVLGKKVLSSTRLKQLDVQSLKEGLYMLKVYDATSSTVKRIVIK